MQALVNQVSQDMIELRDFVTIGRKNTKRIRTLILSILTKSVYFILSGYKKIRNIHAEDMEPRGKFDCGPTGQNFN
jgi:hypothetical protein